MPGNIAVSRGVPSACMGNAESLFTGNEIFSMFGCVIHYTQELDRRMTCFALCSLAWRDSFSQLPFCYLHIQLMGGGGFIRSNNAQWCTHVKGSLGCTTMAAQPNVCLHKRNKRSINLQNLFRIWCWPAVKVRKEQLEERPNGWRQFYSQDGLRRNKYKFVTGKHVFSTTRLFFIEETASGLKAAHRWHHSSAT